jgi:hypothetical protein
MAFYDKEPSAEFRRLNPHIFGPPPAPVEQDVNETKWAKGEEKKLSELVCADLSRRGIPYIKARTDKASTIRKGWPDITAMHSGKVCCVELKAKGGTLSKDQRECISDLESAGIPVTVAFNFDTTLSFILKHLNP